MIIYLFSLRDPWNNCFIPGLVNHTSALPGNHLQMMSQWNNGTHHQTGFSKGWASRWKKVLVHFLFFSTGLQVTKHTTRFSGWKLSNHITSKEQPKSILKSSQHIKISLYPVISILRDLVLVSLKHVCNFFD